MKNGTGSLPVPGSAFFVLNSSFKVSVNANVLTHCHHKQTAFHAWVVAVRQHFHSRMANVA